MYIRDFENCGHYWGMGFFWWFFAIIVILFILIVSGTLTKQRFKSSTPSDLNFTKTNLMHTLMDRLAKGEINDEEYEKRKAIIERDSK